MQLLDHVSISVANLAECNAFYDAIMHSLGCEKVYQTDTSLGYGIRCTAGDEFHSCLAVYQSASANVDDARHWCFKAPSRAAVQQFYQAGLANGGKDNGAPGLRPHYHTHYYAAFLFDPFGNRVEAVFHGTTPAPSSTQATNVIYKLNEGHILQLHALYQAEWWSKGRTLDETRSVLAGSQLTLGITDNHNTLKAFARIITDYTFKAMIFDVIVAEPFRGEKLGERLLSLIKNHPDLAAVKSMELYCLPAMFPFYQQRGFSEQVGEIKLMRLERP